MTGLSDHPVERQVARRVAVALALLLIVAACGQPRPDGGRRAAQDLSTPGWTELPSLPEGAPHSAAFAANEQFLLWTGGQDPDPQAQFTLRNDAYLLELGAGTWERIPDPPFSNPLAEGHEAFAFGDQFVAAGIACEEIPSVPEADSADCSAGSYEVARLDPRARTWERVPVPDDLARTGGFYDSTVVGDTLVVPSSDAETNLPVLFSYWRLSLVDGSAVEEPWTLGGETQSCEAGRMRWDLENPDLRADVTTDSTPGSDGVPPLRSLGLVLWATNTGLENPTRETIALPLVSAGSDIPKVLLVCSGDEVLIIPNTAPQLATTATAPGLVLDTVTRGIRPLASVPFPFAADGMLLDEPVVVHSFIPSPALARLDLETGTWDALPPGAEPARIATDPDRFFIAVTGLSGRMFQFIVPPPGVAAREFPDPSLLPEPLPPPQPPTQGADAT